MKNNVTRLTAAVFAIALLIGVAQLDSARAAFARTTRLVSTGLTGLKEFIRDMRTREPQPPSAIPPADTSKQQAAFNGRCILANVHTILVEGGQENVQDLIKGQGIEWEPAGNYPNTWYASLDPGKTERFIEFTQATAGFKLTSSPSLMMLEGQAGIIGIVGAKEQDAVAFSLVATLPEGDDRIDLSFSFLQGETGFEVPSLRINTDDAVLFKVLMTGAARDKQNDQDNLKRQDIILVLVKTKIVP